MQFSFIRKIPMDMLYNSDTYSVMHLHVQDDALVPVRPDVPALARHGFEIVDKRSGKEIYLEGSWAEQFQAHLRAWQENAPTQPPLTTKATSFQDLEKTLEEERLPG